MSPKRVGATLTLLGCLAVTACIGDPTPSSDGSQVVSVFGPYRGVEADRFVASLEGFTDSTGITVRYTGSGSFVSDLITRTGDANDPPDVALVPQPGLVRALVDDERLEPLSDTTIAALSENYGSESRQLGEIEGVPYGVPFRANVKSLVWYRPGVFAEHGWRVPDSLDELEQLAATIASDTEIAPWCFTMAAGSATGWTATDWTEDLVLRRAGPEIYHDWSVGDVAFADPSIRQTFEEFRSLVLAPGRLDGGVLHSVETPTRAVVGPLFGAEPGCAMAKQADFALSWMPGGTSVGHDGDVDWFVLPGVDIGQQPPLVIGGDIAIQFGNSSAVEQFLTFLAGPTAGDKWAREGGFLSPKSSFDPSHYPDDATRELASLIHDANVLAFDASDQMPVSIGSGRLWPDITSWVTGSTSYDDFAVGIDAAFTELD